MSEKVQVFVIDPPWPKRKGGLRGVRPNQGRQLDYQTMSVESIFKLIDESILPLADNPCNVFLWSIDQFLLQGEQEMISRGFRRHARFIWDKGNVVAPCFTVRYSHEYLVWFYRDKLMPISTEQRGKFLTVIREAGREHSRKPAAAYAMIESMYPLAVKMDVFSREKRLGWLQFGNQTDYFHS